MIIIFDLLSAQPQGPYKFHGGGEYIKTVFWFFLMQKKDNLEIHTCYNKENFIDEWIQDACDKGITKHINVCTHKEIIDYLSSLNDAEEIRFFAGLIYAYRSLNIPSNVYAIGTCHGLRAIELPTDKYQLKYCNIGKDGIKKFGSELLQKMAKKAIRRRHDYTYSSSISKFDEIITDSDHSLYSIRLNYPEEIKNKRPRVLYPLTEIPIEKNDKEIIKDDKFIMIISANRWTKNSYRATTAIDGLYSAGLIPELKTRVYGNLPLKIRKGLKNQDRFEFYEYVSSEELQRAYATCSFFLYPTLNEGFGNVPMEAMKYGKTCVISAVCSLPEVYQNSVYYFNPYDIMEIQNRILQADENKIDQMKIKNRVEELQNRAIHDMKYLCSIIAGRESEEL